MFQPVKTRRSFEGAVHQIAYAIRSGELTIGDRLPSERALAAVFQISRPTLREAVRLLTRAGLLEIKPGASGGIFVKSEVVPLDLVEQGIDMVTSAVSSVLEARRLFEPRVAQMAGLFASEDDFVSMQDILDAQRAAVRNRELFNQLDERFHIAMARASGNPTLVTVMRGLLGRLAIAFDMDNRWPLDPERGLALHERTLLALRTRDAAMIESAMDEHLSLLERYWEVEAGRGSPRPLPAYITNIAADEQSDAHLVSRQR